MKLSIRVKLLGLVAIASLAVVAIAGTALRLNHNRMHNDRVEALRFIVEAGHALASRLEDEAAAGRMTREEAQTRFRQDLTAMRYNGKEYLFAFTYDLVGFAHLNPKIVGADVSKLKDSKGVLFVAEMGRIAREKGQGVLRYDWLVVPDKPETATKISYVKGFEPWRLVISTGVFVDDIWSEFVKQLWELAIAVGLVALPAIALIALVGVRLSSAIRRLSAKMRTLASGDLSVSFPEAERGDEIGAMGQAVQVFKTNAEEKARLEAERASSAQQAEAEKRRTLEQMAERFERTVGGVIHSVSQETEQMQREARDMTGAAEQTDALAAAVASATEETSANVQTVAAATEELSSSIGEIGRQVADASRIASEAVATSERANGKVAGLAEAVEKIGAVVDLIHDIASQTNLLALNATIEAARAGDAGKGFAVVASEVKQLATQTAKATEEIGQQVAAIQAATGEAVGEIQGVAQVIGRVNEISARIASAVEEQGAATNEISRNVQQAAEGTREVASKIAGVTAAAEQSGRMAGKVLDGSRHLAAQADTLNGEVGGFLRSLRQG